MEQTTGKRRCFQCFDLLAIVFGIVLLIYFLFSARFGFWYPDEAFYYTVPQRLLNGDRLLLEEWNLTQLSSLFSVVPVWLFTEITGGVEGLILFMRYVFVAVDMLFYAFMYLRLRSFRLWGVLSALLFCGILPEAAFSLNYHYVSSMLVMAVCLLLLTGEKEKKNGVLILTGILFALAVLAEPVLIAIYGVYCIAVLILYIRKQKKKQMQESAYLFCIRTWFWITFGAFIVFVSFLALLLCMGSLQELHKTLPYLFSGEDINLNTVTDLASQLEAVRIFGPVSVICLLACAGGAVWYLISGKRNEKWKLALFLISVFFFCLCCIHAARIFLAARESRVWMKVLLYHEVPALLTAPVWCFLCGKKDSRVTGICTVGVLYSVLVDLSSNVMVGAGGRIAQTAGLLSLGMLLAEFRKKTDAAPRKRNVFHNEEKRRRGTFYAGVSVLLSFLLLWNLPYFFMEGPWKPAERIYDDRETPLYACTLQRGPYKNIRTSKETADIYDTTLNDIDRIVQNANGAPLYIDVLSPYLYLYAGLPYGNFSAWDEEPLGRSLLYWQLFEEKKPGYIYIPGGAVGSLKLNYYPDALIEEEIEEISRVFAVEAVKGEGGYILRVLGDTSEPSG